MTLQTAPAFIGTSGYSHPVELFRNLLSGVFGKYSGRTAYDGFRVTPTANERELSIAAGSSYLKGTDGSSTQGGYFAWSSGADLVTLDAPSANPRIDALILRVIDTQYGSDQSTPQALFEIVKGTPAASPSPVADSLFGTGQTYYRPGAWVRIADVRINPGDTTIPSSQVDDGMLPTLGAMPIFNTTATRDNLISSPVLSDRAWCEDTGERYYYDGTAWVGETPRKVIKSVNESVTNTTTYNTDDELLMSLEASSFYEFRGLFSFVGPSTADFKYYLTFPSGAEWEFKTFCLRRDESVAELEYSRTSVVGSSGVIITMNGGFTHQVWVEGRVKTDTTSGTMNMHWTQATADASSTTVSDGSYYIFNKIG